MQQGVATEIAELAERARVVEVGGVPMLVVPDGHAVTDGRQPEPMPEAVELSTMSGLAAYVGANRDEWDVSRLTVHVRTPTLITLWGPVHGPRRQRDELARVTRTWAPFPFEKWISLEDAVIRLQTQFVDSEDRRAVLAVLGNVRESAVRTMDDSGVSQTVTASKGVALRAEVAVPNPVMLRPYRTFSEIDQPASTFVLRLRSGAGDQLPTVALFPADGGNWEREAMISAARECEVRFGVLPILVIV